MPTSLVNKSCNSQFDFLPSSLPLSHILCNIPINLCLSGLSFRISAGGWSMSISPLGDAQGWLSPLPDSFHQLQARWWLPVAIWSWSWPTQPPAIHCQVQNKRWNCWRSRRVKGKALGEGEERAQNSPGAGLVTVQDSFPDVCFSMEEEHRARA